MILFYLFVTVLRGSIKTDIMVLVSIRHCVTFSFIYEVTTDSQKSRKKLCSHHSLAAAKMGISFIFQWEHSFFLCPFSLQYAHWYFFLTNILFQFLREAFSLYFWITAHQNFFPKLWQTLFPFSSLALKLGFPFLKIPSASTSSGIKFSSNPSNFCTFLLMPGADWGTMAIFKIF